MEHHRQIERWFSAYHHDLSTVLRENLIKAICKSLRIHMTLEEELLYPVLQTGAGSRSARLAAMLDHDRIRQSIQTIERMNTTDAAYADQLGVLYELIEQHVAEEEGPSGTFAAAEESALDLEALGVVMTRRRHVLSKA